MVAALVDYVVTEGVAVITLNDPPYNAYTHEMMRDLDAAILEARFDNDVHALVLTAAGDEFFCTGSHPGVLAAVDAQYRYFFHLHAEETIARLEATPKPVIAALNGSCIAGGLDLALACDLRVAAKDAGVIRVGEVDSGRTSAMGGVGRLCRVVGKARAMALLLQASELTFEDALRYELVHEVWDCTAVPTTALGDNSRRAAGRVFRARVQQFASNFTPPTAPAFAVGRIKRLVQAASDAAMGLSTALERETNALLMTSEDAQVSLRDHQRGSLRAVANREFKGR